MTPEQPTDLHAHARSAGDAARAVDPPLVVDLDGSLIAGDTLWESLLQLVMLRPIAACAVPAWLRLGKAGFKRRVSDHVTLDPASLPYRDEVLAFLRSQRQSGRRLILATAADARIARAVADHLGLFDGVIATEGNRNARGEDKLAAIREHLGRGAAFDYLGDAACDLPIFGGAGHCYAVAPGRRLRAGLEGLAGRPTTLFCPRSPMAKPRAMFLSLRPHQWAKSLLLAVPVVVGHRFADPQVWLPLTLAIVAFCLASSAVYLLNDLADLAADRAHPRKRHRPLASGALAIPEAIAMSAALGLAAVVVAAALLPATFAGLLVLYLVATTAYSLRLKRVPVVDVLVLAGLYTLRIVAGGEATDTPPSFWLLTFSVFIFLSLAFGKRVDELRTATVAGNGEGLASRGYRREDAELVSSMGPTSGYLAVLVFCLYIQSPDVRVLYQSPRVLWLLCPLLLYWVTRFWLKAHRGELRDDPVLFAMRDPATYLTAALAVVVLLAAK
jgi:4-hydroxybenzoate polyprenyltransferase/phosphoserine phosphatase